MAKPPQLKSFEPAKIATVKPKKTKILAVALPKATASLSFYLAPIIIVAGLLRIYNIDVIAIWHNEAVTSALTKLSWREMHSFLAAESVAPLFYILQKIWVSLFGSSLIPLRLLSGLFGLLIIYAGFLFVEKMANPEDEEDLRRNERFAIRAALLLAINPLLIQYSQTAQNYSLTVLLAVISSILLIRLLKNGSVRNSIYYALAIAASLYTSEYLILIVLAQICYLLILSFKNRTETVTLNNPKIFISIVLGALLALPQLIKLPAIISSYSLNMPSFWLVAEMLWKTMFGGLGTNRILVSLGLILLVAGAYYFLRSSKSQIKWLIFTSWLFSLAGALFVVNTSELDLPVSLVMSAAFFAIMLAGSISMIPAFTTRRIILAALLLFSVFIFFKNWNDVNAKNLLTGRHENRKPGTSAIMQFVNDTARKEDKIFAGSPYLLFPIEHYNQTGIIPMLYSPGPLPEFRGKNLAQAQMVTDFTSAQKNDTAWVIWSRGFGGSKPIVPGNWEIIAEKYYPDAPDFKGLIVVSEYHVD